jgi:hypothetical protein
LPGNYTVRLTANGRIVSQPLQVRMDPRVKTPAAALARQFALGSQLTAAIARAAAAGRAAPAAGVTPGAGRAAAPDSLSRLGGELAQLYGDVQGSDAAPTPQIEAAIADRLRRLDALLAARSRSQ